MNRPLSEGGFAPVWRRAVASLALLALGCAGGGPLQAATPLAREGVVAVADSCQRDRWGIDGYHAANVLPPALGGAAPPAAGP